MTGLSPEEFEKQFGPEAMAIAEKEDAIRMEKVYDFMKSIGWIPYIYEKDGKTHWRDPSGCSYNEEDAIMKSHDRWLESLGWVIINAYIENPKFMHHDYFKKPKKYQYEYLYWVHPVSHRIYHTKDALEIAQDYKNDDGKFIEDPEDPLGKCLNKIFRPGGLGALEKGDVVYLLRTVPADDDKYVLLNLHRARWQCR